MYLIGFQIINKPIASYVLFEFNFDARWGHFGKICPASYNQFQLCKLFLVHRRQFLVLEMHMLVTEGRIFSVIFILLHILTLYVVSNNPILTFTSILIDLYVCSQNSLQKALFLPQDYSLLLSLLKASLLIAIYPILGLIVLYPVSPKGLTPFDEV